jgi:hypothetical protein
MWQDTDHAHSGRACLAIDNQHKYSRPASNNWAQELQAVPKGQTIRLTASIKTEGVSGVNVCVQCLSADGEDLIAFTSTPVLRGTNDWTTLRSREIVVPPETSAVIVRAALTGTGQVFFDDLVLEAVGPPAVPPRETGLEARVNGQIIRTLPVKQDAMMISYLDDRRFGQWDWMAVANNDGGVRTVLSFASPSPEEIKRPALKFLLALFARETRFKPPVGRMQVHETLEKWDEDISWKTRPDFAPEPASGVEMTDAVNTWWLFDVTELIRRQARDGRKAFGITLKFDQEDRGSAEKEWSGCQFVSREGPAAQRPMLLVVEQGNPSDSRPASAPAPTSQPTTRPQDPNNR